MGPCPGGPADMEGKGGAGEQEEQPEAPSDHDEQQFLVAEELADAWYGDGVARHDLPPFQQSLIPQRYDCCTGK